MKWLFFLSFLACSCHILIAQTNPIITFGEPYKVVKAKTKYYLINRSEIIAIKVEEEQMIVQKLNVATLAQEKKSSYLFPESNKIELVTPFGGSHYLFYSKGQQLFYREIDFSQGILEEPQMIVSNNERKIQPVVGIRAYSLKRGNKFSFSFAYDSSKMLIHYTLKPKERNDSKNFEIVGTHVFGKNLVEQWSSQLTMPYTEKKITILDYSIDSQGHVYFVNKVYKDDTTDEIKSGTNLINYYLEILKYKLPDEPPSHSAINLEDKFIQTLWLYESNTKDYMIGAGFYFTNKSTVEFNFLRGVSFSSSADGLFLFKLGMDGEPFDKVTHPIPLSILNQSITRWQQSKLEVKEKEEGNAEFQNLKLRNLIVQNDGTIVLQSEQYFVELVHHYGGPYGGNTNTVISECNDILVAKIERDGTLAWMQKLPKRQKGGENMGGMSFHYLKDQGSHHFIFIDNQKNKDLNLTDVPKTYKEGSGGYMMDYTIEDKTGQVMKTAILNVMNVKGIELFYCWPRRILTSGNGTFVFEAYVQAKEDVLIKVDLSKGN
jgi:hypothetical protein